MLLFVQISKKLPSNGFQLFKCKFCTSSIKDLRVEVIFLSPVVSSLNNKICLTCSSKLKV